MILGTQEAHCIKPVQYGGRWRLLSTVRGGHVPMGTVVLGLSQKLAFFSEIWASFVPKTGCFGT